MCAVSVQCIDGASISHELEFIAGKVGQNRICGPTAACNTDLRALCTKEILPDSRSSCPLQKTIR